MKRTNSVENLVLNSAYDLLLSPCSETIPAKDDILGPLDSPIVTPAFICPLSSIERSETKSEAR